MSHCLFCGCNLDMLNQRTVDYSSGVGGLCSDCQQYEDYCAYLDAHPVERLRRYDIIVMPEQIKPAKESMDDET